MPPRITLGRPLGWSAEPKDNPHPPRSDDIPFSIAEATEMVEVLDAIRAEGGLKSGGRHIALMNVYEDLYEWVHAGKPEHRVFREWRGKELFPAPFGIAWDVLERATRDLEELMDKTNPSGLRRATAERAKVLLDQMDRVANMWRHKLAWPSRYIVKKYGHRTGSDWD